MSTIRDWINVLLLLIPSAAGARAVYCIIKMHMDEEQASLYKRRLINLLVFTVIAECIFGLLTIAAVYLGILSGGSGHF